MKTKLLIILCFIASLFSKVSAQNTSLSDSSSRKVTWFAGLNLASTGLSYDVLLLSETEYDASAPRGLALRIDKGKLCHRVDFEWWVYKYNNMSTGSPRPNAFTITRGKETYMALKHGVQRSFLSGACKPYVFADVQIGTMRRKGEFFANNGTGSTVAIPFDFSFMTLGPGGGVGLSWQTKGRVSFTLESHISYIGIVPFNSFFNRLENLADGTLYWNPVSQCGVYYRLW